MHYTKEQRQAIDSRDRNLLILACAGSGKTEVISRRIAELVRDGVSKSEIIAFAFTERAANELKGRIRLHMEDCNPDSPSLGDMYVGTIHSFCLRMLKEIDPEYRKFEVMDEARQAALIMTNFFYYQDDEKNIKKGIGLNKIRSSANTGYWQTVRNFVKTLNIMHQQRISINRIKNEELRLVVERYKQVALGTPNYFFDFDQIISELIDSLKGKSDILEETRNRFKYLVVDEYQDVDDRQEELIRLLSDNGKRIKVTAVGDDDQAIYGWRGARIQNILDFKENYPDVEEVKLLYNFRSSHAIVEIANKAIRKISSKNRIVKDMMAKHWDENHTKLKETMTENGDIQMRTFDEDVAEAEWIADRIKQLHGTIIREKDGKERAIDYADMAVLLRSVRTSGRIFATTLRDKGIHTVVKGVGGLFDNDEVLLIQASFSLLARTDFHFRDCDDYKKLDEVETRDFIREKIRYLCENDMMPHADENIFLEWIAEKREELDKRNLEKEQRGRLAHRIYPQDIFHEMLKKLGSAADIKPWPQEILFNLGRLSDLITQFEAVHQWIRPDDLHNLCIFLGGWAAGQVDEGGLDESGAPNAVQIMTVHAAKGLEWPVVFIPRVSSANFPSNKRNHGPETFLDSSHFNKKEYASGDDGERRLWYVALTRCRKFLNISSQDRSRKKPTIFFKEISRDYVQKSGPIEDRRKGIPAPPVNAELFPTTYSDLNYYWRCSFEYQLRNLMRFSPGVNEAYGYGKQIHNILAEVHKLANEKKEINDKFINELVDGRFHLRYTSDGETHKPLSRLRDAARDTLLRFQKDYPANDKYVLEAEKPFEFIDKESGALISGSIDLIEQIKENPSGEPERIPVAVVDFKAIKWPKEKDIETFSRRKDEVVRQLQLYVVAVQNAFGYDAKEARVHFLNKNAPPESLVNQGVQEVIKVDISSVKKSGALKFVREAVMGIEKSIKTKKFDFSGCDNGYCKTCDFREFCPGYKIWEQKDKITPRPLSISESREEDMRFLTEDENAGETS
jgi:DNA helicase-2/ATP-dependent DNA helicase PcrA